MDWIFSTSSKAKVYLADIKDYGKMNEVYRSYFKTDPPARTCIEISKLVRDSQAVRPLHLANIAHHKRCRAELGADGLSVKVS
ncbi:MAG: hypothetical protein EXQ58_12245 [Acidobacteria bacterium]|nr:hypothetical protein [Acidobacteriota bacterium]